MARSAPADAAPVRALARARGTAALFLVLVWTFAAELAVLSAAGTAAFTYWFVATPRPSPGWVLAWAAHSPFRIGHLATSVVVLWLYGPVVERVLDWRGLAALFVGGGIASTAAQTLIATLRGGEPAGTLGASGGGLALVAYVAGATLWYRASRGRWPSNGLAGLAVGGVVAVAVVLGNDFAGLGLTDGTARFGHLAGVMIGVAAATLSPGVGGQQA